MSYTKAGSFLWAGGGKAGAIVDLWATSRFGGFPAENQAPPSGSPDAGPVTTGENFGNPGAFVITGIAVAQDYYVRIQYGGDTYWGACPAATLGGAVYPVANAAGTLASGYTTTGSFATFLTTASLGVGTWLVNFSGIFSTAIGSQVSTQIAQGTATATFAGTTEIAVSNAGSTIVDLSGSFSVIATVTVAGTLVFQAIDNGTHSTISNHPPTGYTAVRIA